MAMKSSCLVALSYEKKKQGCFHAISEVDFEDEKPLTVYVKGVELPILLTKQLFLNKDESEGTLYLVCSDLSMSKEQIQSTY